MTLLSAPARLLCLALAGPVLLHAASDPRRVLCAQTTTLVLQAANGTIDIKTPLASGTLKTLYKPGEQYQMEGGQEYVLFLNESAQGFFSFDLQWITGDAAAPSQWSCRIRTIATEPFLSVDQTSWTGKPGHVTINMDRTKPLIAME